MDRSFYKRSCTDIGEGITNQCNILCHVWVKPPALMVTLWLLLYYNNDQTFYHFIRDCKRFRIPQSNVYPMCRPWTGSRRSLLAQHVPTLYWSSYRLLLTITNSVHDADQQPIQIPMADVPCPVGHWSLVRVDRYINVLGGVSSKGIILSTPTGASTNTWWILDGGSPLYSDQKIRLRLNLGKCGDCVRNVDSIMEAVIQKWQLTWWPQHHVQ